MVEGFAVSVGRLARQEIRSRRESIEREYGRWLGVPTSSHPKFVSGGQGRSLFFFFSYIWRVQSEIGRGFNRSAVPNEGSDGGN